MTYKNPRLKHVKKIKDVCKEMNGMGRDYLASQVLDQCNLLLETKKGKKLKKVSEDIVSICCKAPVYVKGNVTMNYVCSKCDKACDVTVLSTYSPLLTCKEASEKLLEATRGIPSQTETKKKKKCEHGVRFLKDSETKKITNWTTCRQCKPLPQPECNHEWKYADIPNGEDGEYCVKCHKKLDYEDIKPSPQPEIEPLSLYTAKTEPINLYSVVTKINEVIDQLNKLTKTK